MTLAEYAAVLETTGLPVAYLAFDETDVPEMPFITYQETGSNNFGADGKVYQPVKQIQVDLFSNKKDIVAETKLEEAFNNASIFWQKVQTVDDDEDCQIYTYETEVI